MTHRTWASEWLPAALTAAAMALTGMGCAGEPQNEAEIFGSPDIVSEVGTHESAISGSLPVGTKLKTLYAIYHRPQPNADSGYVQILPKDAVVTVVRSQPSSGYYSVSYSGRSGWAWGAYLVLASSTTTPTPTVPDAGTSGGTGGGIKPSDAVVELLADTNRDGVVSGSDRVAGKDVWTQTRGAVFLPNIDDDTLRCSRSSSLSDAQLAACNDAQDEQVNGADDVKDLAPVRVSAWPAAPNDTQGRITIAPTNAKVRLFKRSASGTFSVFRPNSDTLSAAELREGANLFIEGTDVVRDSAVWDGKVLLTLRVTSASIGLDRSDAVAMRVAPIILFHHGTPVEQLYATQIPGDSESYSFVNALHGQLLASNAKGLLVFGLDDQWTQDFFETGYVAMPSEGGGQHVIRINIRSANVYGGGAYPLRPAGRAVFTALRGKDSAGVQQFDASYDRTGEMDTLNSFGNTETIPPFTHNGVSYPFGRILRGSIPSFHPDPSMTKMFNSQGVQPVLTIDTSWLLVGHVDETISFIPAKTPRGWVALVNDPALARSMLQQQQAAGRGNVRMFVGKRWLSDWSEYSAEVSINTVLADTEVMSESAKAAAAINAQVAVLKQATGLTDAEIIRIPYLHYPSMGYSLAYQPGTVNGVVVNANNFIAPDPFGPVVNGADIFKSQLQQALAPYGMSVRFVDDWNLYHRLSGEVHCGSNAARVIPQQRWWEAVQ